MREACWSEIKTILDEALELPSALRQDFLRRRCQNDQALRREVESYLDFEDEAAGLIEKPVLDLLAGLPPERREGQCLGPYKLQRELAAGGMGVVYLAHRIDGEFRQQVAVKVLKRGLDSSELVRRFRRERQILARLDHPHIARVLDGGSTEDGLPYFVMEYIDGIPIDQYCKGLPIETRLDLIRQVCDAVHSAHQNLVVHCDLKPSNILVDADGHPKLLDFGIATLLQTEDRAGATRTRFHLGTPAYASPELRRGEAITTASDVYALGALLFRLLTNAPPPREAEHPSRALPDDPARARRLRGDLDSIILEAMHPEPSRRYASAAELGEDLGRHLAGLPVSARGSSIIYQLGSFVQRNRIWAVTGLFVLGLVLAAWQQRQATAQRIRAQASRAAYLELIEVIDPTRHESNIKATEDALARALDSGAFEDPADRALVYDRMGRIFHRLGYLEKARLLLENALDLRKNLSPPNEREISESLNNLSQTLFELGELESAKSLLLQSLEILDRSSIDIVSRLDKRNNLAISLQKEGRLDEAEDLLRTTLAHKWLLKGELSLEVAIGLNNLGQLLFQRGQFTEAEVHLRDTLRIREELMGPDHLKVATALVNLALVLDAQGVSSEALPLLKRALDLRRQKLGVDNIQTARAEESLGYVLLGRSETQDLWRAEELLRHARSAYVKTYGDDHRSTLVVTRHHAVALLALGRAAEAEPLARRLTAQAAAAWPADHWRPADMRSAWGASLTALGHREEAEPLLRAAIPVLVRHKGEASRYSREARRHLEDWERATTTASQGNESASQGNES